MRKNPPYHLRLNKAVDRLLLIEVLGIFDRMNWNLSEYTYIGMGGPLMVDIRLLLHYFPGLKIISIEDDAEVLKRQRFHLPRRGVKLVNRSFEDYLASDFPSGERLVVWADYMDFTRNNLVEFMDILGKVGENSIIRITVPVNFIKNPFSAGMGNTIPNVNIETHRMEFLDNFRAEYGRFLPTNFSRESFQRRNAVLGLVGNMFKIAAQRARPTNSGFAFALFDYTHYDDGTPMISISGGVLKASESKTITRNIAQSQILNPRWEKPQEIRLPFLSLKERLHLEKYLPVDKDPGVKLRRKLGYSIGPNSERELERYAIFERLYPDFVRVRL